MKNQLNKIDIIYFREPIIIIFALFASKCLNTPYNFYQFTFRDIVEKRGEFHSSYYTIDIGTTDKYNQYFIDKLISTHFTCPFE